MDNKKLKKLLVATLAASSTFSAYNASATIATTAANPAGTNTANEFKVAGVAVASLGVGTDIYSTQANQVITLNKGAAINYGFHNAYGQVTEINVTDAFNYGFTNLVNTTTATDVANVTTGNGGAIGFGANAGAQTKVVFGVDGSGFEILAGATDVSGLVEVDFANHTGTFKISADNLEVTNATTFISKAGNKGTLEINAKDVKLSGTFSNVGGTKVNTLKVNDGKDVIINTAAIFAGKGTLGKDSEVKVLGGKSLTIAELNGGAANQGKLTLEGDITGDVGATNALELVQYTGAADAKITGTVKAQTLKIAGTDNTKALTITGAIHADTAVVLESGKVVSNIGAAAAVKSVEFTGTGTAIIDGTTNTKAFTISGTGTLQVTNQITITDPTVKTITVSKGGGTLHHKVAVDVNLVDFTFADGATNFTQLLQSTKAGNVDFTADHDIKTDIVFVGTGNETLVIADGKQILKSVTTKVNGEGIISYLGDAVISQNIGTKELPIDRFGLSTANKTAVINSNVAVWGAFDFRAANQKLTVSNGATLFAIDNVGGLAGSKVIAQQGANIGNVGDTNAIDSFTATGGINLLGKSYEATNLVFDGGVTNVNNNGQDVTFKNLITKNNVTIKANGSKLVLAGANTKIADGTTLYLTTQQGALDLSGTTSAKIGQTNIVLDTRQFIDSTKNLTAAQIAAGPDAKTVPNQFAEIDEITNVADQATADRFTFSSNNVVSTSSRYDTNAVKVRPTFNKSAFDALGRAIDPNKTYGEEVRAMLKEAATNGIDSATQKAAATETLSTVQSVVETVATQAAGILNAIDNFGAEIAAPAAGADYNEMGINVFVTPFLAKGTTKLNGQIAGNKSDIVGASVGMTAGINEDNSHLGIAFSIANSTTKFKDAKSGDKTKGETKSLTIFGDHAFSNKIVTQGIATFGVSDFNATENRDTGQYKGKYTTTFASLLAKVGYNIEAGKGFTVMPYVGLRYDTYKQDSFKLKQNGQADLAVGSKNINKYIASIGTKFTGSMDYDTTHIAPFADVSFGYNLGKKAAARVIDLGNFNPNANYSDNDKTLINGRLGLEARMENGLNVTVGGGVDLIGAKTTVYSGSLKLGYKF
jgi:outer membrane autotransporter protein